MENKFTSNISEITFIKKDEEKRELTDDELMALLLVQETNNFPLKRVRTNRKKVSEAISNSVLSLFLGDAFGVPLEFCSREKCKELNIKTMKGNMTHNQLAGTWSDDGAMTLATLYSIIENKSVNYDDIAMRFFEWLQLGKYSARGKVFDCGETTYQSICNYAQETIPAELCGSKDKNASGNGSLMRMLPIAIYTFFEKGLNDIDKFEIISKTSSITHRNETCKLGCCIYSKYIEHLLEGYTKETAYQLLKEDNFTDYFPQEIVNKYSRILKGNIATISENNVKSTGYIVDSLEASLWSILTNDDYENSIVTAANLGGDTDTIAAITGSIAGIIYNYEDIPPNWIEPLAKKEEIVNVTNTFIDVMKNMDQYTVGATEQKSK